MSLKINNYVSNVLEYVHTNVPEEYRLSVIKESSKLGEILFKDGSISQGALDIIPIEIKKN